MESLLEVLEVQSGLFTRGCKEFHSFQEPGEREEEGRVSEQRRGSDCEAACGRCQHR